MYAAAAAAATTQFNPCEMVTAIMFTARSRPGRRFGGVGTLRRRGVEMEDGAAHREQKGAAAAAASENGGEVL